MATDAASVEVLWKRSIARFFSSDEKVDSWINTSQEEKNLIKYKPLVKLYDRAEVINDLV